MFLAQGVFAAPRVVLHHSFDHAVDKPDYTTGPVAVAAGRMLKLQTPAVLGKAAWFEESAGEAKLRIALGDLMKGDAWTIALWDILEVKEWLTAPEDNLLTLLGADDQPIV